MKNNYKLLLTITTVFAVFTIFQKSNHIQPTSDAIENKLDKKTRADLAHEQNIQMTMDPKLGYVPRERLWDAIKYMKEIEARKGKAAVSGIKWTERGPKNVAGRTRAIMFDPNDATNKRVFAASVAGGLWVTDNIYESTTSWTSVDPYFDNMAITALAHHPTNTDTMYFGTGEGFFNADAIRGDGIFRSFDGGETWTQLTATTASVYRYIQKIIVDASGNVYAATRDGGVIKSTDNGTTWSVVLSTTIPSTGTNASTIRAADMELAANGDIYVAMGIFSTDGIYKSTDGGTSWTQVYVASNEHRIELACAPSASGTVYAVTQNASTYAALNFLRTNNGGSSWTTLTPPTGLASSQAWYDLSLAVDPNDSSDLYIGGLNMWKSTNAGSGWTQVSIWYASTSYPYVHADQHAVVYAPGSSDSILFGNDGGVFRTENGTSSSPSFDHASINYNVTQFYACAIHPTAGTDSFLAGSQDNGSHLYSSVGINATDEVTGGDGAYVHIDQADPSYMWTSYVYNQYRVSTDGGETFTNRNFSSSAGKFINPTDYDNDAQIMYCSHNSGDYLRWTNPRSGSTTATVTFSATGGEPSAIFCDPNTSNRIYIGTDNGEIWQIDNAHSTITATEITSGSMPSGGYVSSIDVEDGDASHILVTFSNYGVSNVWESTNTGTSWTNIDGDLPDMPVRWGMFSPLGADSVFLATELGVWTTDNINGASTAWGASNTGLANVRTDMLQWRASDSTLIAATHGRGLFSTTFSTDINADFTSDKQAAYPCEEIAFQDASAGATTWAWDFDNDGNVDATTQNATWKYNRGGHYSVKLVINGTDSITKTNYVSVMPRLGTPYSVTDGGNFETNAWHFGSWATNGPNLWERGAPSNALSTLNSTSNGWKTDLDADVPSRDIECHLFSPSFNMAATGTYTLSFRKSMEQFYSNAPYCAIVEYSTDGGAVWNKLGTSPDANGTNWYANTAISSIVESDGIGFLENATNENTSYDVSGLAGNRDVRFRFTFKVSSAFGGGYVDGLMIDDFALSGPTNAANAWEVETSLSASATEYLGPNDTVNFISSNCKIIATVINLSAHDYGNTTVTIDAAGSGTKDFSTNTAASQEIFDKTILITPTTNNTSGSVKIKTYFTGTEATAWKTNTGWGYSTLNQIKSTGAIASATTANTIYGTSPVIDSVFGGSDLAIECSYSNGFSGLGAGKDGTSGPLPVRILSFDAEWQGDFAQVKWVTSEEVNVSHFEVQRLSDNRFISIGNVSAIGNSNELETYTFTDPSSKDKLPETILYRLASVDFDGSTKYSNVVRLENKDTRITLHPNPAVNFVTIGFGDRSIEPVDIHFTTLTGNTVKEYTGVETTTKLDVSDMANGIYFIVIRRGNALIETKKIQLVR